jgi:hypothetical protein
MAGNPLYIAEAIRINEVTTLKVVGHGLTSGNVGNAITVTGAGHYSLNGKFTISRVVAPDLLQYNQVGAAPLLAGLAGGAVSFG